MEEADNIDRNLAQESPPCCKVRDDAVVEVEALESFSQGCHPCRGIRGSGGDQHRQPNDIPG